MAAQPNAHILPPDLPVSLAVLEVDPVTRALSLNQEALRNFLKKLLAFLRDSTARDFAELKRGYETEVADAKKALISQLMSQVGLLEDTFTNNPRIDQLDQEVAAISAHLEAMEAKSSKVSERVAHMDEDIQRAVDDAVERRPLLDHVRRHSSAGSRRPSLGGEERGASRRGSRIPSVEAWNTFQRTATTAGDTRDLKGALLTQEDAPPVLGMSEPVSGGYRRGSQKKDRGSLDASGQGVAYRKDLEDLSDSMRKQVRLLEEKVDYELGALATKLGRSEDNQKVCQRELESQGARLGGLEADVGRALADVEAHAEAIERLARVKVEAAAIEHLQLEVKSLGSMAEKGAEAAGLAPRVHNLEQARRALDAVTDQARREIEALQRSADDLGSRIELCVARTSDIARRGEAALAEQMASLSATNGRTLKRVEGTEASVRDMAAVLKGWSMKADLAEVRSLRAALSEVTEDLKDKEQAVLFGARCLSCNRVFDDVQTHSNIVNLRGEKQRAQVFAEIQRALHSPRCDPLEPVKMIAVKVGRPTDIKTKSGLGPLQGRDSSGMARGVEDVILMPVPPNLKQVTPPGTARPATPGRATTQPAGTLPLTARPSTTPGRSAPANTSSATTAGGVSHTTSLAQLRESQLRSGPMDYKHPISHLLGRPGSDKEKGEGAIGVVLS